MMWRQRPSGLLVPRRDILRTGPRYQRGFAWVTNPFRFFTYSGPVFDNASTALGSATDNLSWSHTCNGSNRGLLVGVVVPLFSGWSITGVTYAGTGMTFVTGLSGGSGAIGTYLYKLAAPASGTNTVSITFFTNSNGAYPVGSAMSFTNCHQTTASMTTASGNGQTANGTDISYNVASNSNELVADVLGTTAQINSAGASQTIRFERGKHEGDSGWGGSADSGGSTQPGTTTTNMTWNFNFCFPAYAAGASLRGP